ncbi:uncharacterized protein LOC115695262 [Cannabis sativa]|uniref:uncharacterized protein LOC115695262 n=1 Tax=Cannabis sativa TaxID=3483 RepID=UPI0011DFDD46|nr:uncharacterized protein LOC115695262 [Cannabis sativa]
MDTSFLEEKEEETLAFCEKSRAEEEEAEIYLKGCVFPARFINWILICLKGTYYNLMMNSRLQEKFKGEKDDLIIFCKGNENSVRLVHEAFTPFCDTTALKANMSKSAIYFGGVNEVNKNLHNWATGNLSFARRAQLIHSVLLGIRNFWMNLFILPQKVTTAIDKSCRDFLWRVNGNRNNIWVKWINSIYLKGCDFWQLPFKADDSWYFKKILRLRDSIDWDALDSASQNAKKVMLDVNTWFGYSCWPSSSEQWKIWCEKPMNCLQDRLMNVVMAAVIDFL